MIYVVIGEVNQQLTNIVSTWNSKDEAIEELARLQSFKEESGDCYNSIYDNYRVDVLHDIEDQ